MRHPASSWCVSICTDIKCYLAEHLTFSAKFQYDGGHQHEMLNFCKYFKNTLPTYKKYQKANIIRQVFEQCLCCFYSIKIYPEIKEKTFKVWTYFTLLTSLLTSGIHNILTKNTSKLKEKRCTTYNKVPLYCKEYHIFTKLFLDNNV